MRQTCNVKTGDLNFCYEFQWNIKCLGLSTAGVGTKQMFWREKTHFGAEQYLVLSGPSFFNPQGLSFHKFLMAPALQDG